MGRSPLNTTIEMEKNKKKEFDGFIARIVQHEIDHLNGILFVDHVQEALKTVTV